MQITIEKIKTIADKAVIPLIYIMLALTILGLFILYLTHNCMVDSMTSRLSGVMKAHNQRFAALDADLLPLAKQIDEGFKPFVLAAVNQGVENYRLERIRNGTA